MHDPRRTKRISARDIEALAFIGEGFEVAQYQLHAAAFPNVSAVVVSHFVRRATANGWIAVERWNRVGINRLRLTNRGRDLLVESGLDPTAFFVPRRAVAAKDVTHTLWINDLRVALRGAIPAFDTVLPAWQLQRRFSPAPAAIPDVLAIRRDAGAPEGLVAAFEVDLGGERLTNVFLPKLHTLKELVRIWSSGARAVVVVLTATARRVSIIAKEFARDDPDAVPVYALQLHSLTGGAAIDFLHDAIAKVCGVNSGRADALTLLSAQVSSQEKLRRRRS